MVTKKFTSSSRKVAAQKQSKNKNNSNHTCVYIITITPVFVLNFPIQPLYELFTPFDLFVYPYISAL